MELGYDGGFQVCLIISTPESSTGWHLLCFPLRLDQIFLILCLSGNFGLYSGHFDSRFWDSGSCLNPLENGLLFCFSWQHPLLDSDHTSQLAFCEPCFPCPFSFQSCLGLPHTCGTPGSVYVVVWLQQSLSCVSLGLFCTCIISGWGHGLCWVVHRSGGSSSPDLSFSGFPPQFPAPTGLSPLLLWLERWVFSWGFHVCIPLSSQCSSEGG